MQKISLILITTILLCSCKKSNEVDVISAVPLLGKWVNANQRLDTLDVTKQGSKIILFDNSLFYRTNLAIWTGANIFKKEAGGIRGGEIWLRPYNSTDVYFNNYFKWLEGRTKFEISVQALHPEISALYNITYEKLP